MPGFQPSAPLSLSGTITPTIITEPGGAPTEIIQAGTPFTVGINWTISGGAVPLMAGTFNVQVRFESIGPGAENVYLAAPVSVLAGPLTFPGGVPTRTYTGLANVAVPGAGPNSLTVGAYDMVALLTYTTPSGLPGPIAGYSDEKIVQIFP